MSAIKVDIEDIKLKFSTTAKEQIKLILKNDHTLKGQVFRMQIDGKGCGGFDYALGFTTPEENDLKLPISEDLFFHIDPFTAYYCKEGLIDFILDPAQDIEGFSYINPSEKQYRGKFFKNEEMVPKT